MTDGTVEVVEPRVPEGLGIWLRVRTSGQRYRIAPSRDPRQPRLWRLLVYRCTPGGMPHPAEQPWVGAAGTTREDLPATLAAIRADVNAWLAREECHDLRRWLLTADPSPSGRDGSRSDQGRPVPGEATLGARAAP